jgi:hypothetical protein
MMRKKKMLCVMNLIAVTAISICIAFIPPASAENRDLNVKVMTRNMFLGADFTAIAAATNEIEFQNAVIDTIEKVIQSRIPERAALIAAEIAETKPDLVALQEATYGRLKPDPALSCSTSWICSWTLFRQPAFTTRKPFSRS